jgi:hypothetical protein
VNKSGQYQHIDVAKFFDMYFYKNPFFGCYIRSDTLWSRYVDLGNILCVFPEIMGKIKEIDEARKRGEM